MRLRRTHPLLHLPTEYIHNFAHLSHPAEHLYLLPLINIDQSWHIVYFESLMGWNINAIQPMDQQYNLTDGSYPCLLVFALPPQYYVTLHLLELVVESPSEVYKEWLLEFAAQHVCPFTLVFQI